MKTKKFYKRALKAFNVYASIEDLTKSGLQLNVSLFWDIFNEVCDAPEIVHGSDLDQILTQIYKEIKTKTDQLAIFSKDPTKVSYVKNINRDGTPNRVFTTIGRYIKNNTESGKTLNDKQIKLISELYHKEASKYKPLDPENLLYHDNENIKNKYKEFGQKNKEDGKELSHSCMVGDNSNLVELYALNPDKVQLITIKNDPGVRCLLWTCDDGQKVLDRIYPAGSKYIPLLRQWAEKNGIIYRSNPDKICTKDVIELSDGSVRHITIKNIPKKFPYIDTFCYGEFDTEDKEFLILSNSNQVPDINVVFHNLHGCYDLIGGFLCNDCGARLSEDECNITHDSSIICSNCMSENYGFCVNCEEIYNSEDLTYYNDCDCYCERCIDKYFYKCENCDTLLKASMRNSYYEVDGDYYCEDCFCDNFDTCSECDEYFKNDNLTYTEFGNYCEDCYNYKITECASCNEVLKKEDAKKIDNEYVCESCYDNKVSSNKEDN